MKPVLAGKRWIGILIRGSPYTPAFVSCPSQLCSPGHLPAHLLWRVGGRNATGVKKRTGSSRAMSNNCGRSKSSWGTWEATGKHRPNVNYSGSVPTPPEAPILKQSLSSGSRVSVLGVPGKAAPLVLACNFWPLPVPILRTAYT